MIKLVITKGENHVELEASATNADHVSMALEGAFGVFGFSKQVQISTPIISAPLAATPTSTATPDSLKAKQAREVAAAKSEINTLAAPYTPASPIKEETPASRPKSVELLGSNRSLQVPIAEAAAFSDKPDWYHTGIKLKDGVPHYRTRYWCQNDACLKQSNQYIPLDTETVECHDCGTEMKVRPAIGIVQSDGIPERDRFGNFFRADTQIAE